MKRIIGLLWGIILVEAVICGSWIFRELSRAVPPEVALEELDAESAGQIAELQTSALNGDAPQWRTLAEAYLSEGFFSEAEQCFRRAVSLDSRDEQARYGQGFCLERMGFTQEATGIFRQLATSTDAELARTCWYQIGRNLLREENPEEAEVAFRTISDFAPAAYQLAKILIRSERVEEGVALVESQLTDYPNSLKFHQLLAYAAEAQGDELLARELHQRVERAEYVLSLEYGQSYIGLFRARYGLHRQLANCLRLKTSGSLEERAECLAQAIEIIEANRIESFQSVYQAAAQVEIGRNRPEEAIRHLEILKAQKYETPEIVELWGDAHHLLGDDEKARDYWMKAVELIPNADRHRKLARSFAQAQDPDASRIHESFALFHEGATAFRANQITKAIPLFQQSTELQSENAESWFLLGQSWEAIGAPDRAGKAYDRCLTVDPDHGRARDAKKYLSLPAE